MLCKQQERIRAAEAMDFVIGLSLSLRQRIGAMSDSSMDISYSQRRFETGRRLPFFLIADFKNKRTLPRLSGCKAV